MVMKRLLLALLCLTALTVSAAKKKQVNPIRVTHMRTERMVQPMSVDTPTPRLGWVMMENISQRIKPIGFRAFCSRPNPHTKK